MRRVAVTGLGAVTPIGNNVRDMWEGVVNGRCGIDTITAYDVTDRKVKLAAQVKNFVPEEYIQPKLARTMDRFSQFAFVAADEAIKDSGLDMDKEDSYRCGIIAASGIGGISTIQNETVRGEEKGYDRVSPHFITKSISNMAAGNIAIHHKLKGMCSCVVTACASGTNAIGDAFNYIKEGHADVMICGGSEAAITPLAMGGFTVMKALSTSEDPTRASIPFDKERNGFVMGEGAGMLVLEEYEHALARNAHIYCFVEGYSANCDAYHITAPDASGEGAARCMRDAISAAGIEPSMIDYINAHGTSTQLNDKCESLAVKKAFGEHAHRLAISSTKSMTGHLLGAAGAVEAVITALSLENGFIPATINYKLADEECDLDIVANTGRNKDIGYALSDSLGFGGHNAALVMRKAQVR